MPEPTLDLRTGATIIAHDDHTEVRHPHVGEPIILKPGQRLTLTYEVTSALSLGGDDD
jgi:hypothetical protein